MADIHQIYGRKLKSWSLYKKQLLYPYNNNLRISFWPYISRIFGVCQPHINCIYWPHSQLIMKNLESVFGRISGVCRPYISRISAVYQPYVSRISAVCQPSVSRGTAVCPQYVRRMSTICLPYVSRTSAIPNLPICPKFKHCNIP